MKKRVIAVILSLVMCLGVHPGASVFAETAAAAASPAKSVVKVTAQPAAGESFMTTTSPAASNDSTQFNPYVFTMNENSEVSASVVLQPSLMNISSDEGSARTLRSFTKVSGAVRLESFNGTSAWNGTFITLGDLANANVEVIGTYTFTGEQIQPVVGVDLAGTALVKDSDYTINYGDWDENIYVGDANITIVAVPGGRATGQQVVHYTIGPANIQNATVCGINENGTNAAEINQQLHYIWMEYKDTWTLQEGKDFIVLGVSEVEADGIVSIGFKGQGNFTGTLSKEYPLVPNPQTPVLQSATYSDNTATAQFATNETEIADYELILFTKNQPVETITTVKEGGVTYYACAINTIPANNATTTSGNNGELIVTLQSSLYFGSNAVPVNGDKVYIGVQVATQKNGGYHSSNVSNLIEITVGGETPAVTPIDISSDKIVVKLENDTAVYTGAQIKPHVIVYDNDTLLKLMSEEDVQNTSTPADYVVVYNDNVNHGQAAITVIGQQPNYTGNKTVYLKIFPAEFSGNNTIVNLDPESFTFDGTPAVPSVTVIFQSAAGNFTLAKDTDYELKVIDNEAPGQGMVTVTGKNNFVGAIDKKFDIYDPEALRTSLDSTNTSVIIASGSTYIGAQVEPVVTVKYNNVTLVKDTDYTLVFVDNINKGTATAVVTGKGNYKDVINSTFTIDPAPVDSGNIKITLDPQNATYTGASIEPTATVLYIGTMNMTLTQGVDYDIKFEDNENVGLASYVVRTKDNFADCNITGSFQILAVSIAQNASVTLDPASFTYDGQPKDPNVTVQFGGKTLAKGEDYALLISNNTKVGTGIVTVIGQGNYTGNTTATFAIDPVSLANATITVDPVSNAYTGSAVEPAITVTIGDTILVKDTDYTLLFENNTKVGSALVTVIGTGNYGQNKTAAFSIDPIDLTAGNTTVSLSGGTDGNYTYTASAIEPVITVVCRGITLVSGTDFDAIYTDNINVGTAGYKVTGKGNYIGNLTGSFGIVKADIAGANITLTPNEGIYYGSAVEPAVAVSFGGVQLTAGQDYTVSYLNNTGVGTGHVKVIGGPGNMKGEIIVDFPIRLPGNCTIRFLPNGGTGEMDTVSVTEGTSYTLPNCTFEAPQAQRFVGWDQGNVGDPIIINTNTELVAQWEDFIYSDPIINMTSTFNDTITDAMIEALSSQGGFIANTNNTVFMDITLMVSQDGGLTYAPVTPATMPVGGINVTISYPAGTNQTGFNFSVAHYITANSTVEVPKITKAPSGILFTVHSCSPFAVSYTAIPAAATGDDSHLMLWTALFAVSAMGCAAVILPRRRRRDEA